MIKIESGSLNILEKRHYEYICSTYLCELNDLASDTSFTEEQNLFEYLYNKRKDIVTGKPEDLYKLTIVCQDKLSSMSDNERKMFMLN